MKTKFITISKKPFVRNVMIMIIGTAAAQVITMALSPIITRMYGPEAFGVLGVFTAILAVITPIAALTYPIAIVLPKNDSDAKGLVRLSLYLSAGIAAIVGLILLIFNQPIVKVFQIEAIAPFLYLIPLVTLFSGFLQVVEQWLIRTKQFGITARVTFMQALILQGSIVGIGFFYPVAGVLVVLNALGYALKALMMTISVKRLSYKQPVETPKNSLLIKELGKKYQDFPLLRAPQVFINSVSQSLPILLLASFFGPASAGFYSIGRTVLSMPTHLIGKSVGDVFYPRISEAANNGENLTHLIKKATLSLAVIGVIPFGIVIIFGPWLFSFVFGAEWVTAGEYARWISLWTYFLFINQPSIKAMPVLLAQAFHLRFTIVTLIVRSAALVSGYYLFSSDLIAVALFGVSGAILNMALILITFQISKRFDGLGGSK